MTICVLFLKLSLNHLLNLSTFSKILYPDLYIVYLCLAEQSLFANLKETYKKRDFKDLVCKIRIYNWYTLAKYI